MEYVMSDSFSPTGTSLSELMDAFKTLENLDNAKGFNLEEASVTIRGLTAIAVVKRYPPSMFDEQEQKLLMKAVCEYEEMQDENA
jgi:hypothetical protein